MRDTSVTIRDEERHPLTTSEPVSPPVQRPIREQINDAVTSFTSTPLRKALLFGSLLGFYITMRIFPEVFTYILLPIDILLKFF
jgi:hypothetical protein